MNNVLKKVILKDGLTVVRHKYVLNIDRSKIYSIYFGNTKMIGNIKYKDLAICLTIVRDLLTNEYGKNYREYAI